MVKRHLWMLLGLLLVIALVSALLTAPFLGLRCVLPPVSVWAS